MDFVIGVDPGVSGGMAIYVRTKGLYLRKYTNEDEFVDLIGNLKGYGFAAIEHVPKYVGNEMRASHSFTLGYNMGFEVGVIKANGIMVDLVRPQKWQGSIPGVRGLRGPQRKRYLKEHAKKLYPGLKVTLATADALLILDHYTEGKYR